MQGASVGWGGVGARQKRMYLKICAKYAEIYRRFDMEDYIDFVENFISYLVVPSESTTL